MDPVLVQKEYMKNPNMKQEDIQCIRDWLKQQPHLPHEFITDLDIILAYHSCEGHIEQTMKVIDRNYTLRSLFSFYRNRPIDTSLETALNTWLICHLSQPSKAGYSVIYCQLLDTDPQKFVYRDVVKLFGMLVDLWQSEQGTVPGVSVIVNMDKVSMGHLSRIDLTVAQQFFYFLQEAMFVRLKEFHFINAPNFIDMLMSMVKPFMGKKLLDMVKVHPIGSDSLEEFIPMAALPKDAGGDDRTGKALRDEIWNKIKTNEKFFENESKKRVDESKRPGGPHTISTFFTSLDGSFKKLQID